MRPNCHCAGLFAVMLLVASPSIAFAQATTAKTNPAAGVAAPANVASRSGGGGGWWGLIGLFGLAGLWGTRGRTTTVGSTRP